MIKQFHFIFFSFVLLFFQQQAMFKVTGSVCKKYTGCTLFAEKVLKVLKEKDHAVAPNSVQLFSQVHLDKPLMTMLGAYAKVYHTNVLILVSKMVWLNQKESIDSLKSKGIDIRYFPDKYAKYKVTLDGDGNIMNIEVSENARNLRSQTALLSYDEQHKVFISKTDNSSSIIRKEKTLSNPIHEQIIQHFFKQSEEQFNEITKESQYR